MAKAPASTVKQGTSGPSDEAADVVKDFKKSWSYAQTNHHPRWERNGKLYNNQRVYEGYKGITNTFIPMTFSVVETITASLANGRPNIEFVPQDMYSYISTYLKTGVKPDMKPLNSMFDYYWDADSWDLKTVKTVRNGLIEGTSAEYLWWDGNKPRIINLAVRDLIIDPDCPDPLYLWTNPTDYFSGRRYLTNLDALKAEEIVDPDTGKMQPRFQNLDKVQSLASVTPAGELTEREIKDMQLGSLQSDADNDQVEVIEINYGDRIKSVANRNVVIEDRENKLGIHNIAIHRFIADESIIYGKSVIDPIAQEQELLNDVTNQRVDAVTDALNPMSELDPAYASWINKVKNAPGAVYPFKPGSLQPIAKNPIPQAAFQETMDMKNSIREATAADQVIMGVNTSWRSTATEIKAQLAQAGQRFDLYVMMLEKEAFYQRAKIVYKMMRTYLKGPQLVPTSSIDGPKFYVFNPENYDDTYEPQIKLSASIDADNQKQQEQATQAYQEMIADPTNDLWQIKKTLYPKMFSMTEEELDKIIGPQPPQGGMPGGLPGGLPGGPPGAAPGGPMGTPALQPGGPAARASAATAGRPGVVQAIFPGDSENAGAPE